MDAAQADYAVRQLSDLTITLRDDLLFTPRSGGGETYYVIEDPVQSKFHRVGAAEYLFISLLDGSRTIGQAQQHAAQASPDSVFSEHEVAAIGKWLVEARLAHTPESLNSLDAAQKALESQAPGWRRVNPVFTRVPIVFPDRFFVSLTRWIGWVHSPAAIVGWAAVLLYAVGCVARQGDRFANASEGVLAPGNWIGIGASYLLLKLCHEVSHGVACRRHGGSVREIGVMLLLMFPIPYVDATSSWRFPSKWHRVQVAAAGMYVELFLASLAAIAWSVTEPGLLNQICYNTAVVGSVVTLAVNANPLMRFDGYYILSDLADVPNLYAGGQQHLKHWARRRLLGAESSPPRWSRSRAWLLRLYGPCSLLWRVSVCFGLVVGASVLFHGAGVVLSCAAIALWAVAPMLRFVQWLGKGDLAPRQLRRLALTCGTALAAALLIAFVVPWPGRVTAPAVVEHDPLTVVRAGSAGRLVDLRVASGQRVEPGQLLAVIENDELAFERIELQLAIEQARLRRRSLKKTRELAEYQSETKKQESLEKKLVEKQRQVRELHLRAKTAGVVQGRNLGSLLGRHFEEGDEILSISGDTGKALHLSVGEHDIESFRKRTSTGISIHSPSVGWLSSRLTRLDPRADHELIHPALSASVGGPLVVRVKDEPEKGSVEEEYELVSPRFAGRASLDATSGVTLHAGQVVTCVIYPFDESVGEHLYQVTARWLKGYLRAKQ